VWATIRERVYMRKLQERTWLLVSLAALAVPLGAAAVAYGCTATATLSPGAAAPGSTVTVTGRFFGTHDASPGSNGPVELRLGSLSGPVVATAVPSGTGSFSVPVAVPANASPGETILTATQQRPDGTAVYGTPARQTFTVLEPAASMPVFGPVIEQPAATTNVSAAKKAALADAIAACNHKYTAKQSQSSKVKKGMAAKRAACIKAARRKFA
jgi:hypothetical protein